MNTFVVTKTKTDEAISLLQTIGLNHIQTENSHNDAVKSCSTSNANRCLITNGGIDIGHQSIEHVKNELLTIGNTSDLVLLGDNTYILTKEMAQSWIDDRKDVNAQHVIDVCSGMNCEKYELSQMNNCKGQGLFQTKLDTRVDNSCSLSN